MSNIPKMGQLPTPVISIAKNYHTTVDRSRLRYLRQRPGTLHQLHSRRKDIQRTAAKEVQHMPREGHPGGGASHKNGE